MVHNEKRLANSRDMKLKMFSIWYLCSLTALFIPGNLSFDVKITGNPKSTEYLQEGQLLEYKCAVFNAPVMVNASLIIVYPNESRVLNHTTGNGTFQFGYHQKVNRTMNELAAYCKCNDPTKTVDTKNCTSDYIWYYISFYPTKITMNVTVTEKPGEHTANLTCQTNEGNPKQTDGQVIITWRVNGETISQNSSEIIRLQNKTSIGKYKAKKTKSQLIIAINGSSKFMQENNNGKVKLTCCVKNYPNGRLCDAYTFKLTSSTTRNIIFPTSISMVSLLLPIVLVIVVIAYCRFCRFKSKRPVSKNNEENNRPVRSNKDNEEESNYLSIKTLAMDRSISGPTSAALATDNPYLNQPVKYDYENWGPGQIVVDPFSIEELEILHSGNFFQVSVIKTMQRCELGVGRNLILKTAFNETGVKLLEKQCSAFEMLPTSVHTVEYMARVSTGGYIMENYKHKDLRTFMRDICATTQPISPPTSQKLLKFCHQIVSACDYLVKHKPQLLLHCLSADNILIDEKLTCKLTGFATEDDIKYRDRIEMQLETNECNRWKAPEVFTDCKHTEKSDVWSFGITMFEIVTCGETPYANLIDSDIQTHITDKYLESKPFHISDALYNIMLRCWQWDPENRPSFEQLTAEVTHLKMNNLVHINYHKLKRYVSMAMMTDGTYMKPQRIPSNQVQNEDDHDYENVDAHDYENVNDHDYENVKRPHPPHYKNGKISQPLPPHKHQTQEVETDPEWNKSMQRHLKATHPKMREHDSKA